MEIRATERAEKRKSEVEQSKVYADVYKSLIDREAQLTSGDAGELMEQFIELVAAKPSQQLTEIT